MVNSVRAKFRCHLKDATGIYFHPVYTGSDENKEFFDATPGGQLTIHIRNSKAAEYFEQGKEYYLDFKLAE